ncbi:MAG: acetyl-CoA hydrolase/transferase [Akkermansiaceae bacterium]|nr:acetyl-CoA hydrolase/transferase [Akkermansiaceae bacterium]
MKPLDPSRDWPRLVRPGSRLFLGGGASVPHALVDSLLAQSTRLMDLEMVHIHGLGPTPWIDPQYEQVLRTNSFFLTPGLRAAVERGQADYTPCAMSEVPALFLSGRMPLDVALIQVTPPDASGHCSLGVSVDVVKAAVKSARLVIAQINPQMPWTGGAALIPAKRIDYFIEKSAPLPECEKPAFDDRHERIGRYAAQLIEDGATLQVGLGNSPEAVIRALRKHRHLGIHTGMLNDALMELIQCGAVDHSRKNYLPGKIVASHVVGSRKLYRFVDRNPDLELRPSEWVNDPMVIGRNHRMVAVNGAREIDLTGQVVRDSRGHKFYGGIGALQDFVRGAGRSKGGRPIVVLTATSDDGRRSRVVTGLEPGSGVSTSRGDVHHVVTEYGIASIYGRSIRERVARLIEIAHPVHREDLLEGAHARGWLPKFFTMPVKRPGEEKGAVESAWVDFTCGRFLFRPLYPSDMRGLQEFFYSHDEETIRLRYGYLRDRMSGESAYKLAAVDQTRDLALGLFEEKNGRQELRATGRFYLDEGGASAEIAFVVHESTRRAGMAGFLLGELARVAKRRGIRELWASVLPENRPMSGLLVREGGTTAQSADLDNDERHYRLTVAGILRRRKKFMADKQITIVDR